MGHKKAALALLDVFKRHKNVQVEAIDVLEYAAPFYRFLYTDFYVFLMTRAKLLWGAGYWFSNQPLVDFLTKKIRSFLDYRGLSGLEEALVKKAPDAVVATHFFLTSIADILKKRDKVRAKLFALVTDYGPHSFWLSDSTDRYFVGADSTLLEFTKRGIPEDKIDVTGISTTEEFRTNFDEDRLREEYGADKERKTIFLMTGGFGVGPMEHMLLALNKCRADIQVIAVCGHNKAVYKDIEILRKKLNYPVILFAFTDKVAELMSISDIMITKAGGISVTEALDMRLPMILFGSIPGQEDWNERMLISSGSAKRARKIKDIPVIADEMLLSPGVYGSFKSAVQKVRRPDAAERIVEIVLGEVSNSG